MFVEDMEAFDTHDNSIEHVAPTGLKGVLFVFSCYKHAAPPELKTRVIFHVYKSFRSTEVKKGIQAWIRQLFRKML